MLYKQNLIISLNCGLHFHFIYHRMRNINFFFISLIYYLHSKVTKENFFHQEAALMKYQLLFKIITCEIFIYNTF